MDQCGDPHSQMMMHQHGHNGMVQMQRMSGGPIGMHISEMMPVPAGRKMIHDGPVPAGTKKRKKTTQRSQSASAVQSMNPMMMSPQMELMRNREIAPPIVAQNPFDDFADASTQQSNSLRMPHPSMQMQQRMFSPNGPQYSHHPGGSMPFRPGQPHMLSHGPSVNVQQMQHQMEMRGLGPHASGKLGHPDASGAIVYPDEKKMVFNPQNPNAPPIYPCGKCHKEVHENDQGIFCESGCNFWFHRVCTGLTEMAFLCLTHEIYAEWACDSCIERSQVPFVKIKP